MSKFRELVETILKEYDRDDPTDNFWQASKEYKQNQYLSKKDTLYSKPINPVKLEDKVYIKLIVKDLSGSQKPNILYLTDKNQFKKTYDKNLASRFLASKAEAWIEKYPKQIKTDEVTGKQFEYHYEIEKI